MVFLTQTEMSVNENSRVVTGVENTNRVVFIIIIVYLSSSKYYKLYQRVESARQACMDPQYRGLVQQLWRPGRGRRGEGGGHNHIALKST